MVIWLGVLKIKGHVRGRIFFFKIQVVVVGCGRLSLMVVASGGDRDGSHR